MPYTDKDGRRLSGAAQRKLKRQRIEHERTRNDADEPEHFDMLPAPPIDDTASLITWGAKALALVLDRAIRDRTIFGTERDQLRFVADGCAKLGMIRDKASEQQKLTKVAEAVGQKKGAAKPASKSIAGIQKPDTARRTSSASGA